MKINIKERIAAIRKLHTYGPTPMEDAILNLIEDLSDSKELPEVEEDEEKEE